jgi:hypothetical protein
VVVRGPDVVEGSSMVRRAGKVGPRRAVLAVVATATFVFLTAGVASAGVPGRSPVISFSSDNVTLTLPIQGCPPRRPDCEWMLFVNEPVTGKLVGTATVPGTATVKGSPVGVSVALPAGFCGVVQADALIGPSPWRKVAGRKVTVQTSASCSLPFTAVTAVTPVTAPAPPKLTQLPFTGIDVKPLTLLGLSITMLGMLLATHFDQRRNALQRAKVRTSSTTAAVSRWLFGD